jgi:pyridoxal phosphate enzyme (YggS family)
LSIALNYPLFVSSSGFSFEPRFPIVGTMSADTQNQITENLKQVQKRIADTAKRAGRDPAEITLVAVSKFVGADEIRAAYNAGQRVFGESRIQECQEKVRALTEELPDARFTMIGHLQSNKVKKAVELFSEIQSVDSLKIAQEISRRAVEAEKTIDVYLELNSSGESAKYGIDPELAQELASQITKLPNLTLSGIMTLGPLTDNETEIRAAFKKTREVHESLWTATLYPNANETMPKASMGMSADFEIAIEEGSAMVRVGTAIFGPRQY